MPLLAGICGGCDVDVPPLNKCKFSILSIAANYAGGKKNGADRTVRWTRPIPRQVKLNVDASFHDDMRAGATGAVLRDYQGKFIAASSTFIPHISTATMAEARAMKEGLILACRLGCNSIMAKSDSIETIDACTGVEAWWNDSAAIFADIVDLASRIDSIVFKHIPREANMVAHEIAK